MDSAELDRRFAYHPPVTVARQREHEQARGGCWALARELNELLPDGREKSLAITRLEEALFWANAALARRSTS